METEMYENDHMMEDLFRLKQKEMERRLNKRSEYNHYPKKVTETRDNFAGMSLILIFIRNVFIR